MGREVGQEVGWEVGREVGREGWKVCAYGYGIARGGEGTRGEVRGRVEEGVEDAI